MKVVLLRYAIFICLNAWAAPIPGKTLKAYPATARLGEVISLEPKKGFHFNLGAPQRCGLGELTSKTENKISCRMSKPGINEIRLSVCDDGLLACYFEVLKVDVTVSDGYKPSS